MAIEPKSGHNRPKLGRGLSSLIVNSTGVAQDEPQVQPAEQVITPSKEAVPASQPAVAVSDEGTELSVDLIGPNPYQPRKDFRSEELAELAKSIATQGILQPLIVVKSQDANSPQPYVLVAGERRLRAARLAKLAKVPCIIRKATRQQMVEWALVENIQRADLNPVEKAKAYREYMDRFNLTQIDAAERLGQARATVANYLRILDLNDDIQKLILDGALSFGHAKVLAGMPAGAQQLALAKKAADGGLSVRELEKMASQPAPAPTDPKPAKIKPAFIRDLEEQLTRATGTRVAIMPGRAKNTGRILVEYYNLDDFDRLAKALGVQIEG